MGAQADRVAEVAAALNVSVVATDHTTIPSKAPYVRIEIDQLVYEIDHDDPTLEAARSLDTIGAIAELLLQPHAPIGVNRLIVIAGQSNAIGLGVSGDLVDTSLADPYATVQYIEKATDLSGTFQFATDGPHDLQPRTKAMVGQPIGTFGIELSLGRALVAGRPNDTWYIAKIAVNSSSLVNHWNNPNFPTTPPAPPSLYDLFVDEIQARMAAWDAELTAILWIQGEADVGNDEQLVYQDELEDFFGKLRAEFGIGVNVILNRLSSNFANTGTHLIRARQEAFVLDNPYARIVYADELGMQDTAHFSTQGFVDLGNRFGEVLLDAIDGATPTSPYWAAAGSRVVGLSNEGVTPAWPSSHAANDIGILIHSALGNNAYATPEGWTALSVSPQKNPDTSTNARLTVWWKRATSNAEAAPTVADVASDSSKMAMIVTIRGAATIGNPFDDEAGDAIGVPSTDVAFPGGETTGTNRLVLNILAAVIDLTTPQGSGWVNADLAAEYGSDVIEHADYFTTSGAGFGIIVTAGRKATAGTFGTTIGTLVTSATQARISLAVMP